MIKKIPKPKSQSAKIKTLRNKADRLYQEVGRKENDCCLVCGGEYSCLHHFFPKSVSSALRYNLENGIPICQRCHFRHHSANDPIIHATIVRIKGDEWLQRLEKDKHKIINTSQTYYKNIINNLEDKLKQYDTKTGHRKRD